MSRRPTRSGSSGDSSSAQSGGSPVLGLESFGLNRVFAFFWLPVLAILLPIDT